MFWSSPKLKDKIIPTFEHMHSTGHQALILINNSQGHFAYFKDALLISWMNVNAGGKQIWMHDGWFIYKGLKITQPIIFSANHPTYLNIVKGIKAVLTEYGLYKNCLWGKCKKCTSDSCCGKHVLELQPDFQQQNFLMQEVIEAAGHLYIRVVHGSHFCLLFGSFSFHFLYYFFKNDT